MAASDNVVRAGLTPKHKDVANLVSMLTYKDGMPNLIHDKKVDEHTSVFSVPIQDFMLERIELDTTNYKLRSLNSPSIVLVYNGEGSLTSQEQQIQLQKGTIFFVPAGEQVECHANGSNTMTLLRCACNC